MLSLVTPTSASAHESEKIGTVFIHYGKEISKKVVKVISEKLIIAKNTLNIGEYNVVTAEDNDSIHLVVGTSALERINNSVLKGIILTILVDKETIEHAKKINTNNRLYAIYSDPNIYNQISLIQTIMGNDVVINIISSDVSCENFSANTHTTIVTHVVKNSDQVNRVLKDIENDEAILFVPDSTIVNKHSYRNILLTTYRRGIPTFGYTTRMVKSGALATIYHTLDNYVAEAITWIKAVNEGKPSKSTYVETFEIAINQPVAKSFSMDVIGGEPLKEIISRARSRNEQD